MNQKQSIGLFTDINLIEDTEQSQIYSAIYRDLEFKVEIVDIQKIMQVKETQDCFWSKREILIKLANENDTIYKCYQSFEENNQIVFIYKKYDQSFSEKQKPFSLQQSKIYAAKLLQAMSLLHAENFIHREISPQSLCFIKDRLKLKILNQPRKLLNSITGCVKKVGVLGYMAPEIVQGGRYGLPADIFSCGVVIYEMFHGRLPFSSNSQEEFLSDCMYKNPPPFHYNINKSLELLVINMLAFSPEQRITLKNIDFYTSLKTEYKFMKKFIIYCFGCLGSKIQNNDIEDQQLCYFGYQLIKIQIELLNKILIQINEKKDNLDIEEQILTFIQLILISDYQDWAEIKIEYYTNKANKLQKVMELDKNQRYPKVSIDQSLKKIDYDTWLPDFKEVCKNNESLIPKELVQQALKIILKLN